MWIKCLFVLTLFVWRVNAASDGRDHLLTASNPDVIPEDAFQLPLFSEDGKARLHIRSLLEPLHSNEAKSAKHLKSRPARYSNEKVCDGACITPRACVYHQGSSKGACANGNICCHFEKSCGGVSREKVSFFQSPYFPKSLNESLECSFRIYPSETTCAIRIDFERFELKRPKRYTKVEKCVEDLMFIMNSGVGPVEGLCEMENHTAVVEVEPSSSHPILILFIAQSRSYSWNLKITQINCKKLKTWENSAECGRQLMYEPNEYDSDSQVALESPYRTGNSPTTFGEKMVHSPQTMPYIVNGKDSESREFPWQVSLQSKKRSTHRCGGSIINERYILTAAHCVSRNAYISKHKLRIIVGDYILGTEKDGEHEEFDIENIIIHYGYKPTESHMNDIAIIKLNGTISFNDKVQPVCLTEENFEVYNKNAVVSGWGRTDGEDSSASATRLQKLNVKIIDNEECRRLVKREYEQVMQKNLTYEDIARTSIMGISETQLCGLSKNNTSVCFGDSGGPLVIQNEENGRYYQAGVVSYGIGKCRIDREIPGSYTNVKKYLNFIAMATMEP